MKVLITGSNGLIGSSAANFFLKKGATVFGIDNNMRQVFFGKEASTDSQEKILEKNKNYHHFQIDIRETEVIKDIFKQNKFDLIIHTAAQPSHDKAKEIPILDFEINALSTLNLLEFTRQFQREAVFIFTSTNKVYGDMPNKIPMKEGKLRYSYADGREGVDENLSIDQNTHSLFGVSKLSADMYVQEYGRYFNLKTTALRLGCVTGSAHASTKLHGFLSFFIKSLIHDGKYQIIGYKGKQVRDQIHADDVVGAMYEIYKNPNHGEVFNLGGGKENNASILELLKILEDKLEKKFEISYENEARVGDHICYITDLNKFQKFYPNWKLNKSLNEIIDEIINFEK
jgi:CDP-paratose 2-epimerase